MDPAAGGIQQLGVTAAGAAGLAPSEGIVARHFKRLAVHDERNLHWTRPV